MGDAMAECQPLMNMIVPLAEQMLVRNSGFLPFGFAMKESGEIVTVAGYDDREHPPTADIIRLLKKGFVRGARSGEYKATVLVYDVKVLLASSGQKSDAIAMAFNHRDNYSLVVCYPYQLKNGQVVFGEAFANKGEGDIFPAEQMEPTSPPQNP